MADDLRRFAFHRLPEVLKRQTNNYTSMVSETANALHESPGRATAWPSSSSGSTPSPTGSG